MESSRRFRNVSGPGESDTHHLHGSAPRRGVVREQGQVLETRDPHVPKGINMEIGSHEVPRWGLCPKLDGLMSHGYPSKSWRMKRVFPPFFPKPPFLR